MRRSQELRANLHSEEEMALSLSLPSLPYWHIVEVRHDTNNSSTSCR